MDRKKIPSHKARITAEAVRRLSGQPAKNCVGCAYLYVVPNRDTFTNWVGCAQDIKPPPLDYGTPQNCPAPWYRNSYTYLNTKGELSTASYSRIGKLAMKNAHKYFDFTGDRPRLRSKDDPANS